MLTGNILALKSPDASVRNVAAASINQLINAMNDPNPEKPPRSQLSLTLTTIPRLVATRRLSIYDTSNSSNRPDRALTLCKSILEQLTFENYDSHQERWVHSGTFNTEAGAKAVGE